MIVSLLIIFGEFSVKLVYLTMVGEYFQIYGVQITGKCILQVKKMNLNVFTTAFRQTSPPKILTSPARQRKLTHFPNKEASFENLFFLPAERGHYDKKLYEKSSAK